MHSQIGFEPHWFVPEVSGEDGLAAFSQPTSKVVCVGRNYREHALELGNSVPQSPLLFIKPNSSLVGVSQAIQLPQGECHYELEIALLVKELISKATPEEAMAGLGGVGLGLDLTLRQRQSELKAKGQPWEKAKAFDSSCVVTDFSPVPEDMDWSDLQFSLDINDHRAQTGDSADMLFAIPQLVSRASHHFSLYPGDIILTGTPAGVGRLNQGDQLVLRLQQQQWQLEVA